MFPLDSPDRKHTRILGKKGIGSSRVGDQTAGQGFHGDKAHIMLLTAPDQAKLWFAGEIAEGKLQGIIETRVNGLLSHSETMVGDGDEADLPLLFCLQRSLIQSASVFRFWAEGRIVELINVYVIGF